MPPREWRLWHTIQQNLPPIIEKLDKILASENE
jgi:hypothetical protein